MGKARSASVRPTGREEPLRFFGRVMSEPKTGPCGPYAALPEELWKVVEQVGKLKFPIDSKRDLVRKLGPGTRLAVAGATSETVATFFPASYYPLTSVDNFAEKLAEFYHHRRDVRPRIRPCTAAEVKARVDRLFKEQPELIEAAARLFLEVTRPSR